MSPWVERFLQTQRQAKATPGKCSKATPRRFAALDETIREQVLAKIKNEPGAAGNRTGRALCIHRADRECGMFPNTSLTDAQPRDHRFAQLRMGPGPQRSDRARTGRRCASKNRSRGGRSRLPQQIPGNAAPIAPWALETRNPAHGDSGEATIHACPAGGGRKNVAADVGASRRLANAKRVPSTRQGRSSQGSAVSLLSSWKSLESLFLSVLLLRSLQRF